MEILIALVVGVIAGLISAWLNSDVEKPKKPWKPKKRWFSDADFDYSRLHFK